MDISWTNTAKALQDFASILVCGKCGFKPISPVRLTNCGHFFCHDCIKSATICVKCDIPVQPREINLDCLVSNLIQGCDTIAQIIKRENIWDNIVDVRSNISVDKTVSEVLNTPRKHSYIKKNINKPNAKGETQLHTMCLKKNAEQVKQLLIAGANPNTKDNAGWTPLQEMVSYGCIEICKLLLSCGALPNISGYEKKTPLHDAAESDRIEEAKLLLDYHADKNLYDQYGKKPIDYCKSDEMRQLLTNIQSSSEKILDKSINQTLDTSLHVRCDKFVIYASNLKHENQKLLSLIATKHKLKILTTYRSSITHVIVEVNERNVTKLTLDVLFTIVHGSWLLNSEWIKLAADIDDISNMDFELFEVNGPPISDVSKRARQNAENQNPRLFNNCFFYFVLKADITYRIGDLELKKKDLIQLVTTGEGTVLSRQPNPEDLKDMMPVIPFHIANDSTHPLHKCTHYIIYMPGKGEPRIKYKMPHIKSLPLIWLIECIEKFTLVNPAHLGLS
ncbi:brca1-associated ring domain protein 1-like protein [Lasius niger]|uniref:Brca1-associated ring domain protein 1-like protein n=1 Tax=Lasius niger TaxID=67767 RepID=A0A0J7L148_LASNI|nr:brca1-associated ring domain protein 1-like protein [Lasius niger]KMQ96513.1 brca1-associated ring domain protein 1-like protein [Lasius niger]